MNTNTMSPVLPAAAPVLRPAETSSENVVASRLRLLAGPSVRVVLIALMGAGLLLAHANPFLSFVGLIGIDLVTLALLGAFMKAEGRTLKTLFAVQRLDLAWSLLYSAVMIVGFIASNVLANLIVYHGAPPMPAVGAAVPLWIGVAALIAPATTALAEEGLYRAYMLPRASALTTPAIAVLLSTLYFSLQHVGFALGSVEGLIAKLLTTFFAGLIFAGLWLAQKRPVPLVVGHWILDVLFLGLPVLLMAL